ncbi:MAG: MtnX-like HAD-IB family phosphatase [Candidatus Obscuribacterales bacterium]
MKSRSIEIFCDFDGTITVGDTVDLLLESLATDQWRAFERLWERGEIGSRECMAAQIPLIQGGWEAIERVLAGVEVDRTFATFVSWARGRTVPLSIVSDGLDRVIRYLLSKNSINVDRIWSNHLVEDGDTLSLEFPPRGSRFVCASGHCKCQILDAARKNLTVIIGDGRSDFCWAANADVVFAKDKLLTYCQSEGIACLPYESFLDVRLKLEELLDTQPVDDFAPQPVWQPIVAT